MTSCHHGVFAALLLCSACGSSPTAPTPSQLVSLLIEPSGLQVGVGVTTQLTARGRYSDGSSATVAAQWTVTPNSVAAISSTGLLIGLRLGTATASAQHESGISAAATVDVVGNPAIPIPPETNFSGLWEGQYIVDSCTRVSGDGPSTCRFVLGTTEPIRLELTEADGRLDGRLTLYTSVRGDVNGWRDAFTNHVLFGLLTGQGETEGFTFELTRWQGSALTAGEIAGSFEGIERFTASGTGPQIYLRGGTFAGLRRVSGSLR